MSCSAIFWNVPGLESKTVSHISSWCLLSHSRYSTLKLATTASFYELTNSSFTGVMSVVATSSLHLINLYEIKNESGELDLGRRLNGQKDELYVLELKCVKCVIHDRDCELGYGSLLRTSAIIIGSL